MSWKLRVLVSVMLLVPQAALTLGLGEIRLDSALNEPLSAEIDLVAATADELSTLQAQLASRELFQRYGLDRPAYLDSLEFRVGRGQDGRSVLLVRSREAISEPFVSFLVDVSWPRGHLLREYTVLLDPPVFATAAEQPAPAPLLAPIIEPAPAHTAAAPATTPAPVASTTESAPAPADVTSYRVERGDTLYEIAGSLTGGERSATNRTMIGLFRANPEAFRGNINVLRAGAILRVPAANEIASIEAGEANSEVSRQIAAWRAAGGGTAESGRLRLVTPEEGAAAAGAGAPTGAAGGSQVEALQREVEQQRRLLELKNQELAKLQRELARSKPAEPAVPAEPEAPAGGEAAVAPEDDAGAQAPPTTAEEPTAKARPKPQPAVEPKPAAEPSFFDKLTDNWLFLLGAAALLLAVGLGYGFVQRRREQDVDEALKGFEVPPVAPVPSETVRLRALALGEEEIAKTTEIARLDDEEDFIVEERPVARPVPRVQPEAAPAVSVEETISAEAALDLDQADPLAEADFHMAYGLYDQACDLVRMALKQQPDRNDLKLKLAEIHFVAGDTEQFLAVARDLRKSLPAGGDWDRIVIMGRQLAPDNTLFAGSVQTAGVDLSLEGGDSLVDLDLLSAPSGDEGIDLDLGQVLAASDSDSITGEREALEFNLDDGSPSMSTTQQITGREGPNTVEMPTLEIPVSESPTVETLALQMRKDETIRENVAGQFSAAVSADATAEMAIDDLGLDVDSFEGGRARDDVTVETPRPDEATQIAAHAATTRLMPKAVDVEPSDSGGTSIVKKLDLSEFGGIDLDVGGATDDRDREPTATEQLAPHELPRMAELEPVTMSEVGTKLDLARAYMDMGDPDGARNILQEVLAEGSASQKQEARRLIDSLPGA